MRSKSIISSNAATKSSRCLLADKRMLKELCSCNEHGETKGFDVRAYAQRRKSFSDCLQSDECLRSYVSVTNTEKPKVLR